MSMIRAYMMKHGCWKTEIMHAKYIFEVKNDLRKNHQLLLDANSVYV